MNLICFGDSITHARHFAEGDRWPTILQFLLEGFKPGEFKVYNRGIGGHTSGQGLDRFLEDVSPLLPGLVLVEFGFNDCNHRDWQHAPRVGVEEFRKNLTEFARAVRAGEGQIAYIVNHTIRRPFGTQGNGKTYEENFAPYNPAIREVAREVDAPTIDLPALMEQKGVDLDEFLGEDGLHLSEKGNHTYAGMVFEALKDMV